MYNTLVYPLAVILLVLCHFLCPEHMELLPRIMADLAVHADPAPKPADVEKNNGFYSLFPTLLFLILSLTIYFLHKENSVQLFLANCHRSSEIDT